MVVGRPCSRRGENVGREKDDHVHVGVLCVCVLRL